MFRRLRARSWFAPALLAIVGNCLWGYFVRAQEIHVGHVVPISAPEDGWHNWTDIEADPEDPHRLIACGDRWSSRTNSLSGFLYASFDGGASWQLQISDTASPWVSEESCAFGPDGRAYFMTGVSKVVDSRPYHELGKMHLYRSLDGGHSWSSPLVWPRWADFTSMTVDSFRGPRRGWVYIFNNRFTETAKGGIELLYSDDSGVTLKGPVGPWSTQGYQLRGTYPSGSKVLQNGSAIATFTALRDPIPPLPGPAQVASTEVIATESGKAELSEPVQVMRTLGSLVCGGNPAIGVDQSNSTFRGRIYVARPSDSITACQIALSSSSDNGKTWTRPALLTIPKAGSGIRNLSIAVNTKGIIGLVWAEKAGDCWRFSASTDGGASLAESVPLSPCATASASSLQSLNHSLLPADIDDRDPKNLLPAFSLRALPGAAWKTSMAVSPDGFFHPVWMENGAGGQIWTASVGVGEPVPTKLSAIPSELQNVSSQVTFAFANSHFDATTGTVSIDVSIINKTSSANSIQGPLVMQVTDLYSAFGPVEAINADNGEKGSGALWDLSHLLPSGPLRPGDVSTRCRLAFHISDPKLPSPGPLPDLVIVRANVFGKLVSVEMKK